MTYSVIYDLHHKLINALRGASKVLRIGTVIVAEPKRCRCWVCLAGYLSGLLPEGSEPSLDAIKAQGWPADVHVIGKDILR
eukprot:scaffold254058_cov18-Prasinocladus_malaysianus.AAC.2